MKRFLKIALAVIVQLMLLGFFDYFVINSIWISSVFTWVFFAAYNIVSISAIVMSIVLRHIDDVKVLPSTVLSIMALIFFVFSIISVIINHQNYKFYIISALSMLIISAVMETTMYVIQHYRCERTNAEVEAQEDDLSELNEDDVVIDVKVKIKSSAMLLLMTYITDLKKWDNLDSMPFLDELIQVVTECRQYTYEELRNIEEEIKEQLNALKTYTNNNSVERATSTANQIISSLQKREKKIKEIENMLY